ncbi:hypothetical protein AB205_0191350 [Aquarana catesbeiana]|uniref:Uncharacterized protein n=1 Tax=Aquarana catesbeiana TaxID=8400 RepID=A0A2G9RTV6_AQUCT|nr:hypothetical protein AB205_0191350 [Aquarana catesbeiana]
MGIFILDLVNDELCGTSCKEVFYKMGLQFKVISVTFQKLFVPFIEPRCHHCFGGANPFLPFVHHCASKACRCGVQVHRPNPCFFSFFDA